MIIMTVSKTVDGGLIPSRPANTLKGIPRSHIENMKFSKFH